jgi:hypothetical protein
MAGQDHIINPGKELERVKSSIKQYEMITKTTTDPFQQKRVARILSDLREYRDRIVLLFHITENPEDSEDSEENAEEQLANFLGLILARDKEQKIIDVEIHNLNLYMDFFYEEFLSFFSERKLKLDFKHTIERDSAHHKFMDIKRRVEDFEKETITMKEGHYQKSLEQEIKLRNIKLKRTLFIEAHKFFLWIKEFADTLIQDLEHEGLLCLNGEDIISFELNFENHYCEGLTVKKALGELSRFADEVLAFLNIPDIESY